MSTSQDIRPPSQSSRPTGARSLGWIFLIVLVAFGLRLAVIPIIGDATNFRTAEGGGRELIWDWGYEQAAVADSIARGDGFSDPFNKDTGATAWAAPAYPLLVAGLLRATDGPTWRTALWLGGIQALASALSCVYLLRLGRALHSTALGYLAAVLWALHPMAAYLPVTLVWDSTFVALGLTWFLAHLAESGRAIGPRRAAGLGAQFGLLLLVNPAPLALVPMIAAYVGLGRPLRDAARGLVAFAATSMLVTAPWTIRNAVVLGSPGLRSNMGVELFVGNNDEATGAFNGHIHPAYNDGEFARYIELGEVAYSADCKRRAIAWAREHPGGFTRLTLERAQRFWIGPRPWEPIYLGMGSLHVRDWQGWIKYASHALAGLLAVLGACLWRGGAPGSAWIVRGVLLLFPLVYYATHVFERYRFPIEPIVTLCASFAVMTLFQRVRARRPGDPAPDGLT